ncbi:unnamed protein product [Ambrosiozyma monospora]|uniref:Unnamed protein product n=1 Tax=Ambrosiozyma monospora TaxID=43982 RepID=A0ACB5TZR4_AMBMO|nr:unnamed protein product [Ambrosiozyma monospora]
MSTSSKAQKVATKRKTSSASSKQSQAIHTPSSSIATSKVASTPTPATTTTTNTTTQQQDEMFTKEINAISLSYLINECVPLSMRVDERLSKKETNFEALLSKLKIDEEGNEITQSDSADTSMTTQNKKSNNGKTSSSDGFRPGRPPAENDLSQFSNLNILDRVERCGFEIGYKITDCLVYMKNNNDSGSGNNSTLKLVDALEIMKFIYPLGKKIR